MAILTGAINVDRGSGGFTWDSGRFIGDSGRVKGGGVKGRGLRWGRVLFSLRFFQERTLKTIMKTTL